MAIIDARPLSAVPAGSIVGIGANGLPTKGPGTSAVSAVARANTTAKGTVNLALGRPYTASVGYNQYKDNSGVWLTDGEEASSRFQTYIPGDIGWYDTGAHTDLVTIDLGRLCLVESTRGYYGSNGTNVLYPTVTVLTSTDGVTYTQAFSGTYTDAVSATGAWLEQTFTSRLARYVRFSNASLAGKWAFAGEFQVWGTPVGMQPVLNVVFTGDSLTAVASSSYPAKFLAGITGPCASTNIAVGGKTCEQLIADDKTRADSLIVPGMRNVILAGFGTNDLFVGTTASALEGFARTYCNDRKAAGFDEVFVWTVTPRSSGGIDPGYETQRAIYNPWLRANYSSFADGLIDVAADTRLGPAGSETNTYLYSDLVHMTATGCGLLAGIALRSYNGMA